MLSPENFVSSVNFFEVSCLPSFFLIGTCSELVDPVKVKLFEWLELQLELFLINKEDQAHTSSSCVDCMLGKIVVKACSFPSAAQRKCHCT